MTAALELSQVSAGYGRIPVLSDVTFAVPSGGLHAVLGANGAGKTTLLRTIMGLATLHGGSIQIRDAVTTGWPTRRVVRDAQTTMVPEGREVFPDLTVAENLLMGAAAAWPSSHEMEDRVESALALFPRLRQKYRERAGRMSGGEQQMVAIARALMAAPRLLLADEISQGLAPIIVEELFETLTRVAAGGTTVVVVEQSMGIVLHYAESGVVLKNGRVVLRLSTREELAASDMIEAYLG